MFDTWWFYDLVIIIFFRANCFYFLFISLPLSLNKLMTMFLFLVCSNEKVATLSTDAIGKMASSPAGMVWFQHLLSELNLLKCCFDEYLHRHNISKFLAVIMQDVVFPANTNEATHLGALAAQCSPLVGWLEILLLIVIQFIFYENLALLLWKNCKIKVVISYAGFCSFPVEQLYSDICPKFCC